MHQEDTSAPAHESAPTLVRGSSETKDPLIGTMVGRFRLVRKLGGGGMGTIYLGEHASIGSKVAVKFLHEHLASNEALVQRFLAEARAVNLIGHENIINIFDMNVLPPRRHYLVMEYLDGNPLASFLRGPVAPSVAVPILTQVCDALHAAHAHGVIHRDLKPENIFLLRRERTPWFVKVLDFGIAKLLDRAEARAQTAAGIIMGTPEYMAPEQWMGQSVDGRTDLYALGNIAYTLLTGRRPFGGDGLGSLLQAHMKQVPASPRNVNPDVSAALSDVVMRAMAKRPEDRFRDAPEMREALERATAPAVRPASPIPAARTLVPSVTPAARLTPLSAPVARATPPTLPISRPPEAHVENLIARVTLSPGTEPVRLSCTELSRAGVLVCTEGTLPPLRSRVALTLELRDRWVPCIGEVVRHATPTQASAWGMRAGFAVQFVDLSTEARDALSRVAQGQTPPPQMPKTLPDDPAAAAMLDLLQQRMSSDPYVLLGLSPDATFDDVRQHVRNIQRCVEGIAARPLSARQMRTLDEMRTRVEKATDQLSHPRQRIEHDAWHGNYAGVARCIASGLMTSEIDSVRARYLIAHPGAEVRERMQATSAAAWEAQGQIAQALTEYEKALGADPLNLQLQQRYWNLKRRDPRPGAVLTQSPSRHEPEPGNFEATP